LSRSETRTATELHNLPLSLTSFIGRKRERDEVKRLLASTAAGSRLLTLTGAGGCGKTRLALEVAREAAGDYPGGVWLVDLTPISDPTLVPQAVASVLGVREAVDRPIRETLVDFLRAKTLLLLLDNCEHLVGASAELAEMILRSCPSVRILATSQEILGAAGETTWRVPSLAVPAPPNRSASGGTSGNGIGSTAELLEYESVRLFVERASAMRPGFAVSEQSLPAVVEICRRLDGIPLAIELAAARIKLFSVEQIAGGLDDVFRLLSGGQRTAVARQQTLRATVDWSHQLLSGPERILLRRLSVFAGGWTFEAAESVCAGEGLQRHGVLDLLGLLVDKSLVLAEEHQGAVRYRLLETIRQYASEKLQEAGEAERLSDQHRDFFLRLAEEADVELRGSEQRRWLDHLEVEHDNLRTALRWSLATGHSEAAVRLSGALSWYWSYRGYVEEGRRGLAQALAMSPEPSAARMRALNGAAWLAHNSADSNAAQELLEESLSIALERSDHWAQAWVTHLLGRVAYYRNDPDRARDLGQQSLIMAERIGDRWLVAWALHLLGLAAHIGADYETAGEYYARSLEIRREIGYPMGILMLQQLIGDIAFRAGDVIEAYQRWRESLVVLRELGHRGIANSLAAFASLAAALDQPVRAVRLAAATAMMSESSQTPPIPLAAGLLGDGLARAREALDQATFAAAWTDGQALSIDQCFAEALAVELSPSTETVQLAAPTITLRAGLTATELQVLRLLALGCTTREIADELVIAVSTVDRHLTHIYGKLGVRNRTQATAFALQHGLG
jgi:predicted ATPase/DNA-binding CsgD family transcriptional regulator